MHKTLFFFVFLFFACKTSKDIPTAPVAIDFEPIGSGILYGAGEEGLLAGAYLVNSVDELSEILSKMNSQNSGDYLNLTPDDSYFNEHSIVFLFDQVRGSGGHTFEIKKLTRHNDLLKIGVLSAKPEGMATTVMTQPFQIIEIPKFEGRFDVELISP
jgi:hypothetical protein